MVRREVGSALRELVAGPVVRTVGLDTLDIGTWPLSVGFVLLAPVEPCGVLGLSSVGPLVTGAPWEGADWVELNDVFRLLSADCDWLVAVVPFTLTCSPTGPLNYTEHVHITSQSSDKQ